MAEKFVPALRVRLRSAMVCDVTGVAGMEWSALKVKELRFFPDQKLARCRIGGRMLVSDVDWADVDPALWEEWERGGTFACSVCGQSFTNAQGLGSHMAVKHPAPEEHPEVSQVQPSPMAKQQQASRQTQAVRR